MKKENPKHLGERLKIQQSFKTFLKTLKAAETKEAGIQGTMKTPDFMKNKKKKNNPTPTPDPRQRDFDDRGKKPDPKKVEQAKTEREQIIREDRPVKK